MVVINIDSIYKSYGIHRVLNNFSMSINKGERVALIGANGSGKTTLFKIMNGAEEIHRGSISIKNGITIGLLDQVLEFKADNTIYDELLSTFKKLLDLEKEIKNLEKQISDFNEKEKNHHRLDKLMKKYSDLSYKYETNGGYEFRNKIIQVSSGLGFEKEELQKKISYLSGGEKSRVGLIKILLKEPDLLLLDEPTNHLDIPSIQWLEQYINDYPGSVIIISHDRYFLDQVIDRIVEINNGQEEKYNGNYSYYLEERKKRFERRLKEYKDQQKKIKKLEESIHQLRVWGRSRDSEKMFKKAKAMEKRLERIDEIGKPSLDDKKMKLELEFEKRSGDEVLKMSNISKSFDQEILLKEVDLNIYWKEKSAIIGANGSGKTTLLNIINGELDPDKGKLKIGSSVKMGYYRQEYDQYDPEDDLVTVIIKNTSMNISEARNALGAFLFTEQEVFKKVKNLSGGEKSRLRLLELMSGDYNFLVLDEPTNHLDLPSREVLEEVLNDYPGTILAVSHDRYFNNKVTDYTYELENKKLSKYYGNYDYYKEKKEKLESKDTEDKKSKNKTKNDDNYYFEQKKREREERKRKRKLKKLETKIESKEKIIEDIEKEMTKPENINDFKKLKSLKEKHTNLKEELDNLYQEWETYIK